MLRLVFVLALAFATCGCGNSSGGGGAAGGSAQLVLTDDPVLDLARFEVDVAGLSFRKLGGATVAALPRGSRVDFAELADVGELVGRIALEAGRYTGVEITLDFQSAEAFVVGGTTPATIVDLAGAPITGQVTVEVTFPVGARPEVVPNRNHVVQLDLDLSQAVLVDTANNRITFRPVIDVEFDPTDLRPAITRGALTNVNAANGRFVVQRRAPDGTPRADVTIATDTTTVYQISGDGYLGATGFAALAALPADSRVYVQGVLDPTLPGIRAVAIDSGAGVPGAGQDHVHGWIIGRNAGAGVDAELTVLGRSVEEGTGTRRWFTQFTVRVAFAGTKVLQRGIRTPAGTDALAVGQRIWAFGTMNGTTLEAGPVENGIVRMLPTSVVGRAAGMPATGVMVLDVARIDGVPIQHFDFMVAGLSELDPTQMSFDVRGLDVDGIDAGSIVAPKGWLNPIGVMADQDFRPVRVVDRTDVGSILAVTWPSTASGVSMTPSQSGIALDVAAAGYARILDAFGGRDLTPTPAPSLQPRADAGLWFIAHEGVGLTLHRSFAAFVADLTTRLGSGATPAAISALGRDEPTTQVVTAVVATVALR